jgi:hypothetical protein
MTLSRRLVASVVIGASFFEVPHKVDADPPTKFNWCAAVTQKRAAHAMAPIGPHMTAGESLTGGLA